MSVFVIGVDPGPTTGVTAFHISDGYLLPPPHVIQCDHGTAHLVVQALLLLRHPWEARVVLAVERFVVRGRAARSGTVAAGEITRNLIGALQATAHDHGARVIQRAAGEVKPWATDARLTAAGLLTPTKGMGHARDAARHALYAAVRDASLPDPLSRGHNRELPPSRASADAHANGVVTHEPDPTVR